MTQDGHNAKPPEDGGANDGDRVAKALARAGVASRREVERLIEGGHVALNGKVLTTPAVKVGPGDILTVDGVVVGDAEPTRLFRYHKPVGLVTTHVDTKGRPTVFDALPKTLPRVISIGRLDLSSEGLLLLTNDGALSRALELPSSGWVRRYRARAYGQTTQAKLDTLKDGITVEGVRYGAIEAKLDKAKDVAGTASSGGRNIWITVTLAEGKNREVRRVLEAIGLKVNRLLRLSYGPFALGTLEQGHVEEVGPRVIRELLEGVIAPANMPKGDAVQFKMPAASAEGRRRGAGPPRHATDISDAEERPRGRGAKPRKGARKPDRSKGSGAIEAEPKKVYKSGWAKPKIKPAVAKTAGGRPFGAKAAPKPAAPRPAWAKPLDVPAAEPRPSRAKPGGRPAGKGRSDSARPDSRSDRPKSDRPRSAGPRSDGPRSDKPRDDRPRSGPSKAAPHGNRGADARKTPSRPGGGGPKRPR
ncbi:MAG: ribosomal large subunit pseudouridine synthase [Caulobacter sp.]|nr:ribosomal large subunit pseudouridine synthase [Caulobacter sp.]